MLANFFYASAPIPPIDPDDSGHFPGTAAVRRFEKNAQNHINTRQFPDNLIHVPIQFQLYLLNPVPICRIDD